MITQAQSVLWAGLDRDALRTQFAAGNLHEVEFDAVVFKANYPNRNFVRFRTEDLPDFALTFTGVPFLRNHDAQNIAARDGTVVACTCVPGPDGEALQARIRLTTAEGIRDFLAGRIDRFSISWFHGGPTECTVCGQDWTHSECSHTPGQTYSVQGRMVLCELLQHHPVGREISAVNVPASPGTQLLGDNSSSSDSSSDSSSSDNSSTKESMMQRNDNHSMTDSSATVAEQVNALHCEQMLAASGLPAAAQAVIREAVTPQLGSLAAPALVELTERLVASQRTALAAAAQPNVVNGLRPVAGITARDMHTGLDTLQEAFDWCLGVQGGPTPPPSLRNIRDAYLAVTGDVEFYGVFNPDYAQLAAATTSTLPNLTRNSLNKVVRQHYDNLAAFRWYERITDVVAHDGSTHDIDLIFVDGLANLPTVGEGAAYTEAAVGDARESMSFGKRGVYVGITLEMFRRSDIARMQAIPRELVKAAIRTRSAAIAGIFTAASGAGPTLADDSTALFHANHGNLGNAAFSAAEWAAARKRIFAQTVPGASARLGLWPAYALVPIDLYDTALEVFGYGAGDVGKPNSGGTAQTVNPYAETRLGDPRPTPIVVPEWTDANDWAQVVDPRLHPVIAMAYAAAPQGGVHALPEIYEVRSETTGLMFTNDTLPIKIRDWWAYGVATHVGVGKNNVAD